MVYNWPLRQRGCALRARARIIQSIRRFFIEGGYLEVETPLRIPAPAPESHIEALSSEEWFLHTSPELCMKRLLAAGYGRLFQICRCWRNEERGAFHLPEFTMLEWYREDSDYLHLMDECEELMQWVASDTGLGNTLQVGKHSIALCGDWERVSVREAFLRFTGMSMETALQRDLFDELMVREIEPQLGLSSPVFLYDYPAQRSALARLKREDSQLAERFELYVAGIELANAFTELTDVDEQRERFAEEAAFRSSQSKKIYPIPEKFLAELPAMPPSAGIALGVDRLVMVLLDRPVIDDVVAFTPEDL